MDKSIGTLLTWLCLLPILTFGQDRYVLHYKYKPQNSYSLAAPEQFMLSRAIDRRVKEGVEVDSTDLPVSEKYIAQIRPLVELVKYHSKWMNASIVVANQEQIENVSLLPFIDSVALVAKGFYPSGQTAAKESDTGILRFKMKSKKAESYGFQNDILGIPAMHEEGFTGGGVMIAVFDAGFLNADEISGMRHLFEQEQIVATKDLVWPGSENVFRSGGHGTASLSLMAAYDETKLVSGAYNAQYILCITEDVSSEYRIEEYNWIRAAEFADSLGVDIINSSLGYNLFDDPEMNYTQEEMDGKTAVITKGATMAAKKGILVISSAGNEGSGTWRTVTAPADAEGILAVGSITDDYMKSSFSSVGPTADGRLKPELVAFGSGVTVWDEPDGPTTSNGTSFTSPQVAALAAGLWEARPELTREQLIQNLLASGTLADSPDDELGYGVPNFLDAYYGDILDIEEYDELQWAVAYPNPLENDQLYIAYGTGHQCDFRMINTRGQVVADLSLTRDSPQFPYEITLDQTLPGLYLIECREKNDITTFRLLKK